MDYAILAILAAMLLAALFIMDLTLTRQDIPWLLVGLTAIIRETTEPTPAIEVGGTAINLEDAILAVAVVVVVGWIFRGMALQVPQILLTIAFLITLVSVARGAQVYGMGPAVNEARETLYFIGAGLLGSFAPTDDSSRRRLMRWWLWLCWIITGLTVMRWVIVFAGLPFTGHWYETEFAGMRVLDSNGTMVLVLGCLMLLPRVLRGMATHYELLSIGAFGFCVVALQHRSVWLALLIGTTYLVREYRKELSRGLVMAVAIGTALMFVGTVTLIDVEEITRQASTADAASDNTWKWRVSGWADLLDESGPAGPAEYLMGQPYGAGWKRSVYAGYDVDVPPHNFYLEMLMRIGLLGVGLVFAAGISSARKLRTFDRADDEGYLNAATLLAILTVQALYSIPYNLGMEMGLLFGLAIAVWAQPLRAQGRGIHIVRQAPHLIRR